MTKTYLFNKQKINYALHSQANNTNWLVLVHGFCSDHQVWDAFVPLLLPHYNLLLPDMAGYGQSDMCDEWTIEGMADRIAALLAAENISSCVLVGHSMGGYVAITFAQRHTHLLKGLLLFHTTAFDDDEVKKRNRRQAIHLIQKYGTRPFLTAFYDSLFTKQYAKQHNDVVNAQELRAEQLSMDVIVRSSEAMIARPDRSFVLSQLPCPVGYVMGQHDTFTTYRRNLDECYLPKISCLYLLPQAGHMSMWEDTEQSSACVLGFAAFCESLVI